MNIALLFVLLVFFSVFGLVMTLVPWLDEKKALRERIQARMKSLDIHTDPAEEAGLKQVLRDKYLRKLSPLERRLESFLFTEKLGIFIEQSGLQTKGYVLLLATLAIALLMTAVMSLTGFSLYVKLVLIVLVSAIPFGKVIFDRHRRLARIEEQLPEAIDMMVNSVRAGHSFVESVRIVSEDMSQPIAGEFAITFAEISYSNDVRRSLMTMLQRVPGQAMMLLVVSVLVQRDTGGNITEVLDHISKMIREKFRFGRRIKTVSAQGRLGGRVLGLLPLVMFGILNFISPDYMANLTESETGRSLMTLSATLVVFGFIWIHKIQKINI